MADTPGDTTMSPIVPTIGPETGDLSAAAEPESGKETLKSLAEMAQQRLLKDLGASLALHAQSATFACGGSVPFITNADVDEPDSFANTSNNVEVHKIFPVQIRFGEKGKGNTLTLPGDERSSKEFQDLLAVCQPASFGRGGEDVFDEDYRKAGKLDRDAFATSFCPYEAGIVDIVAQLLLPQTSQDRHLRSIRVCDELSLTCTMLTFYASFQRPNSTS